LTDVAGVDWILAENWWPYQRPTFVTPNFAGYISGHSTYSRAGAEVLTYLTGDRFFPGGLGEFEAPKENYLVFENGPSETVKLQWATYQDAADQSALSRIWGGIHPPADDIPGRKCGIIIADKTFKLAEQYFFDDEDNDGYFSFEDCDDNDPNVYPGNFGFGTTQLNCNDLINISLDANCSFGGLNADSYLEGEVPHEFFEITLEDGTSNPIDVTDSNAANHISNYVGQTIQYLVTDPCSGANCWGLASIEYSYEPPVPNCQCEESSLPVSELTGSITDENTTFIRPQNTNGDACSSSINAAFQVFEIEVDVSTVVDFVVTSFDAGSEDSFLSLYENCFDPNDPCANLIGVDDNGAGALLSSLSSTLTFGTTYYLVFSSFDFNGDDEGDFVISMIPAGGSVIVDNPECRFHCYDIWDLELLEVPGRNNEVLPPYDNLLPEDICLEVSEPETFLEIIDGPNCGEQTIVRSIIWYWTDKEGDEQQILCEQNFLFDGISFLNAGETLNGAWDNHADIFEASDNDGNYDFYFPEPFVDLPCGSPGTSPKQIEEYFDQDTPGRPSGKDKDDYEDTPNIIEYNEGIPYAYPYVVVQGWNDFHAKAISIELCNLYAVYDDQMIESCGDNCKGNQKTVRTWSLLDWCKGTTISFTQVIKIVDDEGPEVSHPDVTISVDPWACTADFTIPEPEHLHDNCDAEINWQILASPGQEILDGVLIALPKGENIINYQATDCCGNVGSSEMKITVIDQANPVAISKENVVLSLTQDVSGDTSATAKLYAVDVDNFSYDGCSEVHIEIRRVTDNSCNPNSNNTFNNDGHEDDNELDVDAGEYVKFCCEDLTDVDEDGVVYGLHDVIIRVWDDGDMDGKFGSAGDNYNETWASVRVEDKLPPIVICPPHIILDCDEAWEDYAVTGSPNAYSTCSTLSCEMEPTDSYRRKNAQVPPLVDLDNDGEYDAVPAYNPSCRFGAIERKWTCQDQTCDQWIIMLDTENGPLDIIWPEDQVIDCLDIIPVAPEVTERFCEQVGTSLESDTFYFEDGACYKILNHWTVINWCDYNADDPDLNEIEEPGLDDGFVQGYYSHAQVVKLIDTERPELTIQDSCYALGATCLSEGVQLKAFATDNGLCGSPWLKWVVDVDYNADWTIDYNYSSFLPADNPFYINPTSGSGSFVSPTANGEAVCIQLPDGLASSCKERHRVYWTVNDGCGNEKSGTSFFTIEDKKKPTPYMLNVSTAVMENGMVELWARDFDAGSFDACTLQGELRYSFSPVAPPSDSVLDEEVGYYYNEEGTATQEDFEKEEAEQWLEQSNSSSKIFACNAWTEAVDTENILEVEVYVWDECGNYDFAIVNLKLIDNFFVCDPQAGSIISGHIKAENGNPVEGVLLEAKVDGANYMIETSTNEWGEYSFHHLSDGFDYILNCDKNVGWLNGVSTLDLLLIQKHILGLELLEGPYKRIAADANNDQKISAIDLVELRKLILGIYTEIPNNESWRFVNAASEMEESNPWPFTEAILIGSLSDDLFNTDFVGMKIGDVNDSAQTSLQNETPELRSTSMMELYYLDRKLEKDEEFELKLYAADFNDIYGLQFSLKLEDLVVHSLESNWLDITDANFVISGDRLNISYHALHSVTTSQEEALFTIRMQAKSAMVLADNISISNQNIQGEVYHGPTLERTELRIRNQVQELVLSQNQPNPWIDHTLIHFELPTDDITNLSIMDLSGKIIYQTSKYLSAGSHTVVLKSSDIEFKEGIFVYQIESGDYKKLERMIKIGK